MTTTDPRNPLPRETRYQVVAVVRFPAGCSASEASARIIAACDAIVKIYPTASLEYRAFNGKAPGKKQVTFHIATADVGVEVEIEDAVRSVVEAHAGKTERVNAVRAVSVPSWALEAKYFND